MSVSILTKTKLIIGSNKYIFSNLIVVALATMYNIYFNL